MIQFFEEMAVNLDSTTLGNSSDNEKRYVDQVPHMSFLAQSLKDSSVVPSNNGGRIHRLGYIEIIEDDTEKVEVDTEGMTPEELDALRIWEIEKAADEGRLLIHEFTITDEEAAKLGISFLEPCHRIEMPDYFKISCSLHDVPSATNEKKGWRSLRPASRPNKKKGKTYYNFF